MPNLQPFGQNSDSCSLAGEQPFNRQQSLMLMWFDPGCARGRFAEIQEAADFVTEISERGVINLPVRWLCHDFLSISYCDITCQAENRECRVKLFAA